MRRFNEPSVGDLFGRIMQMSQDIHDPKALIEKLEKDPCCSEPKLVRKKELLEMTEKTYEQVMKQHGQALRSYEPSVGDVFDHLMQMSRAMDDLEALITKFEKDLCCSESKLPRKELLERTEKIYKQL